MESLGVSERGFASLVFVVLVSLAITATSVGLVHSIKTTQQINIASNAVTHSENGAWVGVEAFRQFLTTLNESSIQELQGDYPFIAVDTTASSVGQLTARNVTPPTAQPDGSNSITAEIVNVHTSAKSSATIQAIYNVVMEDPSVIETSTVNFDGDLVLTGGLELLVDTGALVDLVVSGNVELKSIGINPLNSITSGGEISLSSDAVVNYIYANDNVSLTGGAEALEVYTLGTFTSDNGWGAEAVWANGNVDMSQNARAVEINSVADILIRGGANGYGDITAGGTLTIKGITGGTKIDSGHAVGNIAVTNGGVTIDEVISEGDVTCPAKSWKKTNSVQANGSLHDCSPGHPGMVGGATNDVVPMTPLDPFPVDDITVDVWKIKKHANYHVSYDSSSNNIKVTVNNIAGITDGSVYYVGNYDDSGTPYKDYLCTNIDSSKNCTALPVLPLCIDNSQWNGCVSYDNDTFTFRPGNMAPAIFFIEGNVILDNGFANSTILASGNIDTNWSSFGIAATNNGSYSKICEANNDHLPSSVNEENKSRYVSIFSTHYPTNLCDKTAGIYTPIPTGNIAFAAGGIDPDGSGAYTGGDITLRASGSVTGSVLAGNILNTLGDTTIHGLISAAGDGTANTDWGTHLHTLKGSTTVNLSMEPGSNFTPTIIPNMGGGTPTVTVTLQGARSM